MFADNHIMYVLGVLTLTAYCAFCYNTYWHVFKMVWKSHEGAHVELDFKDPAFYFATLGLICAPFSVPLAVLLHIIYGGNTK